MTFRIVTKSKELTRSIHVHGPKTNEPFTKSSFVTIFKLGQTAHGSIPIHHEKKCRDQLFLNSTKQKPRAHLCHDTNFCDQLIMTKRPRASFHQTWHQMSWPAYLSKKTQHFAFLRHNRKCRDQISPWLLFSSSRHHMLPPILIVANKLKSSMFYSQHPKSWPLRRQRPKATFKAQKPTRT